MKIIFAGTPEFAAIALEVLLHSEHEIIAVYTQPDRPAGRGLKLKLSPVKQLAEQFNVPIHQPVSLKDNYQQDVLRALQADVMVVAAYGLLLPAAVLTIPHYGCVNIHPSLLPRWRGAAPIQRTLAAGDKVTGVTIMQMDAGLDTGPMLLQSQYVPDPLETSQTLHDALASLGAKTLLKALDLLEKQQATFTPQDNTLATYAHKISKEEALIDWQQPASKIEQQIRAFNPWPVAHTSWQNQPIRIWQAKAITTTAKAVPRTLVAASQAGIDIATGEGLLRLLQLQLPGGKVISAADFYNAKQHELIIGQHFV